MSYYQPDYDAATHDETPLPVGSTQPIHPPPPLPTDVIVPKGSSSGRDKGTYYVPGPNESDDDEYPQPVGQKPVPSQPPLVANVPTDEGGSANHKDYTANQSDYSQASGNESQHGGTSSVHTQDPSNYGPPGTANSGSGQTGADAGERSQQSSHESTS